MRSILKKIIRKLVLFIRYNPYNYAIKIRNYLYKSLFKSSGKNFNILDSVIINFPENISVGNKVSIHQFCYFDSQDEIVIGSNVSIGNSVKFITSSHKFLDKDDLIKNQGVTTKSIIIEDNVWIGCGVTILQGVKISKNSIIGANSLVNKDIPQDSIAAGVPCKVIKERK